MNKQSVINYLNNRADECYRLSDRIWENAEIRFNERRSVQDYAAFLEKEGFAVEIGLAGLETAFRATWGNGRPSIGFLAEYDALTDLSQKAGVAERVPIKAGSNGHGCGHNLLGAGSLIAALGLKKYLESENRPGTVTLFGCPAEEGGTGKTFMARDGVFDGLDLAFCWHPNDFCMMPPGPFLANYAVRYSFTGKSAHAAAAPEKGRSALDAVELMNIGVQFLREHMPSSARIHYAILDTGGISPNIVQERATVLYQIRDTFAPDLADLYGRVNDIARGAALMTGTQVEIKFLKGTSNTVLIPAVDEVMDRNMRELRNPVEDACDLDFAMDILKTYTPEDRIPAMPLDTVPRPYVKAGNIPVPGSSDVGDVSWVVPTSQVVTATWPLNTAPHTWQAVACGKSDFAHRGTLFAGQIMAATAIDACEDPSIIENAWKQFKEKTGGQPYKCPLPDGLTPAMLAEETTKGAVDLG